jgi:hypothetical protein
MFDMPILNNDIKSRLLVKKIAINEINSIFALRISKCIIFYLYAYNSTISKEG